VEPADAREELDDPVRPTSAFPASSLHARQLLEPQVRGEDITIL
jgi:hypothetical protein